ncbi:MAG: hypothetical protein C0P74_015270 [Gammaproteobacteria bacterium]
MAALERLDTAFGGAAIPLFRARAFGPAAREHFFQAFVQTLDSAASAWYGGAIFMKFGRAAAIR